MSRSILAGLTFCSFALVLGCGSDAEPNTTPVDSAVEDVADAIDTGRPPPVETGPISCEAELTGSFACVMPTRTAGQTACTEAALLELVDKCLTADITLGPECTAWKTTYAACASCVKSWSWDAIPGDIYPDDYKCYWAHFDDTCARNVNCMFDCQDEVCAECDRDPGDDGQSEIAKCYETNEQPGSKCWDVAAKEGTACFDKVDVGGCNVNEIYRDTPNLTNLKSQILRFYRGACRDNADWANAESGGDAGTTDAEAGLDTSTDALDDVSVGDALAEIGLDALDDATDAD